MDCPYYFRKYKSSLRISWLVSSLWCWHSNPSVQFQHGLTCYAQKVHPGIAHTDVLYLWTFREQRSSISLLRFWTSLEIFSFSSSTLLGLGLYTRSLSIPQMEKSNGLRSGDLGGHSLPRKGGLSAPRASTRPSKMWSMTSRKSAFLWMLAPSCCQVTPSEFVIFM